MYTRGPKLLVIIDQFKMNKSKLASQPVLYISLIFLSLFLYSAPSQKKPFMTVHGEWNGIMHAKRANSSVGKILNPQWHPLR